MKGHPRSASGMAVSPLKCITMDSLMSSSSNASSVFSCGQNKLQEGEEEEEGQKDVVGQLWEERSERTHFSPEYTRGRRLRL